MLGGCNYYWLITMLLFSVCVCFALFVIYFVGWGAWGGGGGGGGGWGGGVTEEERRKKRIHLLNWPLFLAFLLGMILGFVTDHFLSVFM